MKVLNVLNEIKFSGAEVMLNLAAALFKENELELHILSTGEKIGDYAKILKNAGYIVHHIQFSKTPKYFWKLYCTLKNCNYDVIHIHAERAFVWHALIAKISGVENVTRTIHNVFQFSGLLRLRKLFVRWFARKILKVNFISIGDSVEMMEIKNFNNPTKKIYNWIDEKRFYPLLSNDEKKLLRKQLGINEDNFLIISVGACETRKRHYFIIETLKKIIKKAPNIIYLHLGDGALLNDEKELAKKYGIIDNIIFAGQKENVRDYLAASDLFVMVSEYEGLSISSLEAIFCGLPLIVYNTYGLRDVVKDNYNGVLINKLSELEGKIFELFNFPNLCKKFSLNSLKFAKEKFNMEKSVKELIELYKT